MSRDAPGRAGRIAEACLAGLIVLALLQVARSFHTFGLLPPPFFDQPDDTFMDWYNTAYWAHHRGAFSQWLTVYPPISFDFIRLFSLPDCYGVSGDAARQCDAVGAYALAGFWAVNLVIAYLAFRRNDPGTAMARTIGISLGMPMLFAWERGNLVLPCFTAFMLGHSRLLRRAWMKWLCVAVSANFKLYLIAPVAARLVRRQWRWAEGVGVAAILVYVASYLLYGAGTPLELYSNIREFILNKTVVSLSNIEYATSYAPMLKLLRGALPLTRYLGSSPIETFEAVAPVLIRLGEAGVAACFAGALWRPAALPVTRLAALTLTVLMTLSDPGGYAIVFVLFLVFLEPWRGVGMGFAFVCAYLLSVPWDFAVARIAHLTGDAWLSGQTVNHDLALTAGMLVRPLLLLVLEYGLVAASLGQLLRHAPLPRIGAARRGLSPARPLSP